VGYSPDIPWSPRLSRDRRRALLFDRYKINLVAAEVDQSRLPTGYPTESLSEPWKEEEKERLEGEGGRRGWLSVKRSPGAVKERLDCNVARLLVGQDIMARGSGEEGRRKG
jgi:hypothetical protein